MQHRRQRPVHPHAASHALALANLDLADKIAGNFARRTTHSFDDLRQPAVIGLLKAATRFDGSRRRSFRPYARSYAKGKITHFLRDSRLCPQGAAHLAGSLRQRPEAAASGLLTRRDPRAPGGEARAVGGDQRRLQRAGWALPLET